MEKDVLDFGVKEELIVASASKFAPSTKSDSQVRDSPLEDLTACNN